MDVYTSTTIRQYIDQYNNLDLNFEKCFFKSIFKREDDHIIIIDSSLLDIYMEELNYNLKEFMFEAHDQRKYRYNPKRFCKDFYGTTELWFLLLRANELFSISQFNLNIIKMYPGDIINKILDIFDLEVDSVNRNQSEISKNILLSPISI